MHPVSFLRLPDMLLRSFKCMHLSRSDCDLGQSDERPALCFRIICILLFIVFLFCFVRTSSYASPLVFHKRSQQFVKTLKTAILYICILQLFSYGIFTAPIELSRNIWCHQCSNLNEAWPRAQLSLIFSSELQQEYQTVKLPSYWASATVIMNTNRQKRRSRDGGSRSESVMNRNRG